MKFPVFPIPASSVVLAALLLATAGCSILKSRPKTKMGSLATPAPAATPAPGTTPVPVQFAAVDKKFLATAAQTFAYHRRLGALARQYGNSDAARNLGYTVEGQMVIAQESLRVLAVSKQQSVGSDVGGWGHGGLERLSRQRGEAFDRQFYQELKLSGTLAFEQFNRDFQIVVDGQVKEFAKNWYPIVRNFPREAIKAEADLNVKRK